MPTYDSRENVENRYQYMSREDAIANNVERYLSLLDLEAVDPEEIDMSTHVHFTPDEEHPSIDTIMPHMRRAQWDNGLDYPIVMKNPHYDLMRDTVARLSRAMVGALGLPEQALRGDAQVNATQRAQRQNRNAQLQAQDIRIDWGEAEPLRRVAAQAMRAEGPMGVQLAQGTALGATLGGAGLAALAGIAGTVMQTADNTITRRTNGDPLDYLPEPEVDHPTLAAVGGNGRRVRVRRAEDPVPEMTEVRLGVSYATIANDDTLELEQEAVSLISRALQDLALEDGNARVMEAYNHNGLTTEQSERVLNKVLEISETRHMHNDNAFRIRNIASNKINASVLAATRTSRSATERTVGENQNIAENIHVGCTTTFDRQGITPTYFVRINSEAERLLEKALHLITAVANNDEIFEAYLRNRMTTPQASLLREALHEAALVSEITDVDSLRSIIYRAYEMIQASIMTTTQAEPELTPPPNGPVLPNRPDYDPVHLEAAEEFIGRALTMLFEATESDEITIAYEHDRLTTQQASRLRESVRAAADGEFDDPTILHEVFAVVNSIIDDATPVNIAPNPQVDGYTGATLTNEIRVNNHRNLRGYDAAVTYVDDYVNNNIAHRAVRDAVITAETHRAILDEIANDDNQVPQGSANHNTTVRETIDVALQQDLHIEIDATRLIERACRVLNETTGGDAIYDAYLRDRLTYDQAEQLREATLEASRNMLWESQGSLQEILNRVDAKIEAARSERPLTEERGNITGLTRAERTYRDFLAGVPEYTEVIPVIRANTTAVDGPADDLLVTTTTWAGTPRTIPTPRPRAYTWSGPAAYTYTKKKEEPQVVRLVLHD